MQVEDRAEGQVTVQLGKLAKAIIDMADQTSELSQCLAHVLREETTTKEAREPQQELVPLAQEIRQYVERVELTAEKLRSIMTRLEL